MTLEQQVCSLEQAKKLKELGMVIDSMFYHLVDDPKIYFRNEVVEMCKDVLIEHKMRENGGSLSYNEQEYADWSEEFFKDEVINGDSEGIYPAFTVAELGVMLPECTNSYQWDFISRKDTGEWIVGYDRDEPTEGGYGAYVKEIELKERYQYEAEARAAMLIYLLENKHITAEECNSRLTA